MESIEAGGMNSHRGRRGRRGGRDGGGRGVTRVGRNVRRWIEGKERDNYSEADI